MTQLRKDLKEISVKWAQTLTIKEFHRNSIDNLV